MLNIINSDIYRIKKSKLFYGAIILAGLISFLLVTLNRQDIRLGVSVFGNLTTFVTAKDVIALGIQYQKGIGDCRYSYICFYWTRISMEYLATQMAY